MALTGLTWGLYPHQVLYLSSALGHPVPAWAMRWGCLFMAHCAWL